MPMMYDMARSADVVSEKSPAPSVPTGENTYSASVTLTYETL